MMERMAGTGCLELRFGIESGSDAVLARTRKGFSAEQAVAVVSEGVQLFDRVDAFYVWGFPYETMEDFHQSVFQMISFRMMGARMLPSLLCFLPQTGDLPRADEAARSRAERDEYRPSCRSPTESSCPAPGVLSRALPRVHAHRSRDLS